MTKTISKKNYKEELIDTLSETMRDLNWFQVQEILDKLDELVDQYYTL